MRLHEWTARGATDLAAVQIHRRQLTWRMNQLSDLEKAALSPRQRLEVMLTTRREVDGMDALLKSAGRPLDPPDSYQPVQPPVTP
jgi:hypothetical protein